MAIQPSALPERPLKALARWTGFVHLLARFYMNYHAALIRASKRKKHRSVDIDTQKSVQGTLWALHWGTVGANHLHDPLGKIGPHARIKKLTDAEIARLKGPSGQRTYQLIELLELAHDLNVRVEVELKVRVPLETLIALLSREKVAAMNKSGKLQFKTLAAMRGSIKRLRPAHDAGGTTILSFTSYKGQGISKRKAWGVVDYVRGTPKWVA